MIKNWFKIFIYNATHNKVFTILTLIGLTLGVTGVILSLLYWNDEHAYNKWNPEKDKVFEVMTNISEDMMWNSSPGPLVPVLMERSNEIESYCQYRAYYFDQYFKVNGKTEILTKTINTQGSFFEFFPFEIVQGSVSQFSSSQNTMALEESEAKRIFGTANPIDQIITTDNNESYVVTAVYRIPGKSSIAPNAVYTAMEKDIKRKANSWGDFEFTVLLKLKDPAKRDLVKKQIDEIYLNERAVKYAKEAGISLKEFLAKYGSITVSLQSLSESRLISKKTGFPEGSGNLLFLKINVGISILVLLLSIFNYVNLNVAYAIKRAKEIGVRKVVGADKKYIVLQFLFETCITSIVSIILAAGITQVLLPSYNSLLNKTMTLNLLDFLPHMLLLFLILLILAGLIPAIYVAKFDVLKVLKGNYSRSKSGTWFRNSILSLQFTIATFFLISGLMVHKQVNYMIDKDLGFNSDQVLTISFIKQYPENQKFNNYERIKQQLLKINAVQDVNISSFTLGSGANSSSSLEYKDISIQGQNMGLDFGYLEMLKINTVTGRYFDKNLSSDSTASVMLNQTAADMLKEKDIVGKEIRFMGKEFKVIGIVNDFNLKGLQQKIEPMTFFHLKAFPWMEGNITNISVRISPEHMEKTISEIEKYWKTNVDDLHPFSYEFVDKRFARTYENVVKQRNLFAVMNIVVILIALFGLFALASYSIERRFKEIAIRKVMGAETKDLLLFLTRQYIWISVVGFILALLPSYYFINTWLNNFAYRIAISWQIFLIAIVLMLILTLTVVLSKAYRATRLDILNVLKYE